MTVETWQAALRPPGVKSDHLKTLLTGYLEWLNSFMNKLRREFDDAQPRDESDVPHNRAARRQIKREQMKQGTYSKPPSKDCSLKLSRRDLSQLGILDPPVYAPWRKWLHLWRAPCYWYQVAGRAHALEANADLDYYIVR